MFEFFTKALRKLGSIATAVTLFTLSAQAQVPSLVFVGGEADDADITACKLSYSSAIAATEASLRYNGMKVASQGDFSNYEAIKAYVNLNALADSGGCAVAMEIRFYHRFEVMPPATLGLGDRRMANVVFCNRGGLITGPTYDLQGRINSGLRDFTDQCISEMSKRVP